MIRLILNQLPFPVPADGEPVTYVSNQDDGFLPDGWTSPFRYYVQKQSALPEEGEPLFSNLLPIPDLWEINMMYTEAYIIDEGIRKANISYASPHEYHNVKCVHWINPDGSVYKIDHYDRYGRLFFTDICALDGSVNIRTYLADGQPVLILQPKFHTYTHLIDGKISSMFYSEQEFLHHYMEEAFSEEERYAEHAFSKDILILTNSDQIEQLETLITELSDFQFHIGAKTGMSDRLKRLLSYSNVHLYEGISETTRNELLETCSYYFDINYYSELCDALYEARRHGLLIIGFYSTIHDGSSALSECKFYPTDTSELVRFVKWTSDHKAVLWELIHKQNKR